MRRTKLTLAAIALVGIGVIGACSALGRQAFQQPVVSLRNVRVNGIGLTGGALDVVLGVYNPNGYRLDATRLSYRVDIGSNDAVQLANGALDSRFTVQDRDSTVVHIPVSFTYAGIGAAGRQLLNSGAVDYHVTGDVTVATPVGNFTIPYSSTGRYTAFSGNQR